MHINIIVHINKNKIGYPFNYQQIANLLSLFGHKVSVLTWNENDKKEDTNHNFVKKIFVRGVNMGIPNIFPYIPFTPSIFFALPKIHPDITYCHSHLFPSTLFALISSRIFKIPSCVHIHGVLAPRGRIVNLIQQIYLHTIGRLVFVITDSIICVNNNDYELIQRYGAHHNKITLLPNSVDTKMFAPTKKEPYLICWVGRMVAGKGLINLVKSIELLSKNYPQMQCKIVGDGPLRETIVNLIMEKKLTQHISVIGPIDRNGVANILSKSSIFVYPSIQEGMPFAILEAMSSENAIIASKIPSLSNLILENYNGHLTSVNDYFHMSTKISELLKNHEKARTFGKNSRKIILERHQVSTHSHKLVKIFEEVIKDKKE